MTGRAEAFAEAAHTLAGTPFRLHGRNAMTGIDCVGVVELAALEAGIADRPLRGYRLRQTDISRWLPLAAEAGFAQVSGSVERGDLLLVRPGAGQHHLLVALDAHRFVHAHAGLRRVTIQPAPLPWPIEHHWRLREKQGQQ